MFRSRDVKWLTTFSRTLCCIATVAIKTFILFKSSDWFGYAENDRESLLAVKFPIILVLIYRGHVCN